VLTCSISILWVQKQGNLESEYEDAYAQSPHGRIVKAPSVNLAVSDGATESSFASVWAKQLTRSFCANPFLTLEQTQERTGLLAGRWGDIVYRKPLPWYAEEKARLGAFATFLGLALFPGSYREPSGGTWQATVMGDSCIFHVREGELLLSVPINDSDDFDNAPALIASVPSRNRDTWQNLVLLSGEWLAGDQLFLATDALAAWFLKEAEKGLSPWTELTRFCGLPDRKTEFSNWAAGQQRSGALRNDDLTCLQVTMS